ncbi:hypothetical protein FQP88_12390 [Vibrio atlanticus]|nr:hypothetical protein FQP88_12390 [Vibrio atlanticus]
MKLKLTVEQEKLEEMLLDSIDIAFLKITKSQTKVSIKEELKTLSVQERRELFWNSVSVASDYPPSLKQDTNLVDHCIEKYFQSL